MMRFRKPGKRNNGKRTAGCLALLLLFSCLLSGCRGIELENKTERVEEYTREQAMILIANERNRYENAYSDAVWSLVPQERKETFDKITVGNVKDFMEEIKLLCMLAEERGVLATSSEREQIKKMTDAYMASLSAKDLQYIGCTREDVQKVYTDYFTACKMASQIVGTGSTDISDSEVKVIRIMQIVTEDLKKAKAILKKIKIDGSDFNSMASRYTESDQLERLIQKSPENDIVERTAFSLEEGQVSNILCRDNFYYIIRCVSGYEEQETRKRKQGLTEAVDSMKYREIMEPYEKEHNIVFFEKFWNEIDFSEPDSSTADGFFDIYQIYADRG